MTENQPKMNLVDTCEFLDFSGLPDDEVQRIKNFLKQPCAAVEFPGFVNTAVEIGQGNALPGFKTSAPPTMAYPMEYNPPGMVPASAVPVSGHYMAPAIYPVATTTVNGGTYFQPGYAMPAAIYMPTKEFMGATIPKMVNGMEVTTASEAEAPRASGGGLMYPATAPWTHYPCPGPAYVIQQHMPAFYTPVASVHTPGMRPDVSLPNGAHSRNQGGGVQPFGPPPPATFAPLASHPQQQPQPLALNSDEQQVENPLQPEKVAVAGNSALVQPKPEEEDEETEEDAEVEAYTTAFTTSVPEAEEAKEDEEEEALLTATEELTEADVEEEEEHVIEVALEEEETVVESTNEMTSVSSDTAELKPVEAEAAMTTPTQCHNPWSAQRSWSRHFQGNVSASTTVDFPSKAGNVIAPAPAAPAVAAVTEQTTPQAKPIVGAARTSEPAVQPEKVNRIVPDVLAENGLINKNQDDIHRLGEILHSLQLDHRHTAFLPRGLFNKGNWCYINATLQALLACPPFYNLLTRLPNIVGLTRNKSPTPIMDTMAEFVHEFAQSATQRQKRATPMTGKKEDAAGSGFMCGYPFEPVYIYEMLSRLKLNAFEGRQEDAEEFLSCLLNGLHDEMIDAMSSVEKGNDEGDVDSPVATNGSSEVQEDEDEGFEDDAWKVMGKRNKSAVTRQTDFSPSPVSDIFCGRIRSALQAGTNSSATLQPFFTLQLDIQSENIGSVKEALHGLVMKESLQDYHCTKTKQEMAASRQITLEELPPILILHLKRFVYDKDGGCQKLSKKVEFNVDLDFSKDLLSGTLKTKVYKSDKQRSYKLIAIVYHCGGEAIKGHYVADVYHQGSNRWLRADDSRLIPIPEIKVLKHPANLVPYLLFYRRQDTISFPPSSSSSFSSSTSFIPSSHGSIK